MVIGCNNIIRRTTAYCSSGRDYRRTHANKTICVNTYLSVRYTTVHKSKAQIYGVKAIVVICGCSMYSSPRYRSVSTCRTIKSVRVNLCVSIKRNTKDGKERQKPFKVCFFHFLNIKLILN